VAGHAADRLALAVLAPMMTFAVRVTQTYVPVLDAHWAGEFTHPRLATVPAPARLQPFSPRPR
jgi:hypothetical protein